MANEYNWGINPFENALLDIIIKGGNIGSKNNKDTIVDIFKYILSLYLKNIKDMVYLDFEIINNRGYYKVIGNNFITALWLSGIIPENTTSVIESNEYAYDGYHYSFDYIKKELKYKLI